MKRLILALFIGLAGSAVAADQPSALRSAIQPMTEGVPQVAVVRLRDLLARDLAPADRDQATAKLGEALVAAGEPEEALKVLTGPAVLDLPGTKFFRAQALAALSRWTIVARIPTFAR